MIRYVSLLKNKSQPNMQNMSKRGLCRCASTSLNGKTITRGGLHKTHSPPTSIALTLPVLHFGTWQVTKLPNKYKQGTGA